MTRQTQFFERFIHRLAGGPSGTDPQPSDVFRSFAQTVERRLTADRAPGPKVRLPATDLAGRRSAR